MPQSPLVTDDSGNRKCHCFIVLVEIMSQILRVGGNVVLKCEEWFWGGLNGKSALGYKKNANWLELAFFIDVI
jgi:hypothetical protein